MEVGFCLLTVIIKLIDFNFILFLSILNAQPASISIDSEIFNFI